MLFKVKLVIEYDNFLELSEDVDYKVLGEEILLEINLSTEYQTFKNVVTELKELMFASGIHRNSTDIVYNNGFLSVIYKILNMPRNYGIEEERMIEKAQISFEKYLSNFQKVNNSTNPTRPTQNKYSQMISIGCQGSSFSFEDAEKIFNYLNEKKITYEVYQGEFSSVEVGASGGFSNILILIGGAADALTILTAVKDLFGGEESAIVGQQIDFILEEKAKELISKRFHIHFDQIFFVEQNNNNIKQFIFKTRVINQFYEVVYDENNKLIRVRSVENIYSSR